MISNRTTVERYYITKHRVTKSHIENVLGPDACRYNGRVVEEMKKLELLKKRAFSFVGVEIKRIMRDEALKRNMIDPVTGSVINRFRDIGKEFNMNVCEKTAVDLFHTCFGVFDLSPGWDKKIEKDFLNIENLVYAVLSSTSSNNEDVISSRCGSGLMSIIHDKKTEIVKLVMIKAKRGHGYFISIRMTNKGPEDKNKRRKKGIFKKEFIVRDDVIASNVCNEARCCWKKNLLTNKSSSQRINGEEVVVAEKSLRLTDKSSFDVPKTSEDTVSTESTQSLKYVNDDSSFILMGQEILSPISKSQEWDDAYCFHSVQSSSSSSCCSSSCNEEEIIVVSAKKPVQEKSNRIVERNSVSSSSCCSSSSNEEEHLVVSKSKKEKSNRIVERNSLSSSSCCSSSSNEEEHLVVSKSKKEKEKSNRIVERNRVRSSTCCSSSCNEQENLVVSKNRKGKKN